MFLLEVSCLKKKKKNSRQYTVLWSLYWIAFWFWGVYQGHLWGNAESLAVAKLRTFKHIFWVLLHSYSLVCKMHIAKFATDTMERKKIHPSHGHMLLSWCSRATVLVSVLTEPFKQPRARQDQSPICATQKRFRIDGTSSCSARSAEAQYHTAVSREQRLTQIIPDHVYYQTRRFT